MGELALVIIVDVFTTVGLILIGVPFALLLGVTAALFQLAPVIGPTLVAIPAAFRGFTVSPFVGIAAAVFIVALSEFNAHVLTPIILGRAVDISPVIVILALLAGATWFGILGAILAVPLAAGAQVAFREVVIPNTRGRR